MAAYPLSFNSRQGRYPAESSCLSLPWSAALHEASPGTVSSVEDNKSTLQYQSNNSRVFFCILDTAVVQYSIIVAVAPSDGVIALLTTNADIRKNIVGFGSRFRYFFPPCLSYSQRLLLILIVLWLRCIRRLRHWQYLLLIWYSGIRRSASCSVCVCFCRCVSSHETDQSTLTLETTRHAYIEIPYRCFPPVRKERYMLLRGHKTWGQIIQEKLTPSHLCYMYYRHIIPFFYLPHKKSHEKISSPEISQKNWK